MATFLDNATYARFKAGNTLAGLSDQFHAQLDAVLGPPADQAERGRPPMQQDDFGAAADYGDAFPQPIPLARFGDGYGQPQPPLGTAGLSSNDLAPQYGPGIYHGAMLPAADAPTSSDSLTNPLGTAGSSPDLAAGVSPPAAALSPAPPPDEPLAGPPPAAAVPPVASSPLPPVSDTPTLQAPAGMVQPPGPIGNPPATGSFQGALDWANRQMNKPYIWGSAGGRSDMSGNAPGYDCSGFVAQFYHQMGRSVPAQTTAAYAATSHVDAKDAQPGDIVEWMDPNHDPTQEHMAIYLGNGKVFQSGGSSHQVNIGDINQFGAGEFEFRRARGGATASSNATATDRVATAAATVPGRGDAGGSAFGGAPVASSDSQPSTNPLDQLSADFHKKLDDVFSGVGQAKDQAGSVLQTLSDGFHQKLNDALGPAPDTSTGSLPNTTSGGLLGTLAAPEADRQQNAADLSSAAGWDRPIPATNPAGVNINGEQLVPDFITPLTSAPGQLGGAASQGDVLGMAGVILGAASDASGLLPGGGEARAGAELAQVVAKSSPEALQSALRTAEQAVADLRARFPQMTEGSAAASREGKQLATLQQAIADTAPPAVGQGSPARVPNQPPGPAPLEASGGAGAAPLPDGVSPTSGPSVPPAGRPYAASDFLERAGNGTGVVPPTGEPPIPPGSGGGSATPQPRPSVGSIVWGAMAEGKKSIFGLTNVHAMNIAKGLSTSPSGPGGAAQFAKAYVTAVVKGVQPHPEVAQAIEEATRDGVRFFSHSPETGGAAPNVSPLLIKSAQAVLGGLSSAASVGEVSKAAGASDQDALRNAVIAGVIGAGAGPTVAIRMHDALWKDAVPLAKVLTWSAAKKAGASGPEAAKFSNNLNGGQGLAQIAGSKPMQDIFRLAIQSPDWLLSQVKLTRDAGIGLAKSVPGVEKLPGMGEMTGSQQLSRDWLIKQLAVYGFATEALQYGLTGHFTDQNTPGHQFMVEVPSSAPNGRVDNVTASLFDSNIQQVLDAAAKHDPGSTLAGKLNPWLSTPMELLVNKRYLASTAPQITSKGDSPATEKFKQAQFALGKFAPLGISGPVQEYYAGAPVPAIAGSVLSGTPMSRNSGVQGQGASAPAPARSRTAPVPVGRPARTPRR